MEALDVAMEQLVQAAVEQQVQNAAANKEQQVQNVAANENENEEQQV
jgi:hypothetical protein